MRKAKRDKPLLPPVVWAVLFIGLMMAATRLFPQTRFAFDGQRLAAVALAMVGLGFGVAGLVAFRRHRTTVDPHALDKASALVTDGVFKITRNPMYVGLALIVLGFGVDTGSLIALSLAPVFVVALTTFQIRPEEAVMRRLFGGAFDDYAGRTPRWLFL